MMHVEIHKSMQDPHLVKMIGEANVRAKQFGWTHWFNDIAVNSKELIDLLEDVGKALPKVKFFPSTYVHKPIAVNDDNGVYQTTHNIRVVTDFYVYMDEFPFALGRVGYGDYSVNKSDELKYMVHSRKIKNAKFAVGREQHCMIMTADIKKGISNACKYLIPFTTDEIARVYFRDLQNNATNAIHRAYRNLTEIFSPVQNRDILMEEIEHLVAQGVTFKTERFRKVAEQLPTLKAEHAYQDGRKITAYFARFRKMGEETYVDIEQANDVRKGFGICRESKSYHINDLPEDLAGSIAVLNILQDGQYVENVGQRVDSNHFWIERG